MKKNGEHFVTCGQMKVLEYRADASGLSYYKMMEAAGKGAASVIMEHADYYRAAGEDSHEAAGTTQKVADNIAAPGNLAVIAGLNNKSASGTVPSPVRVYLFCGKGNNGGDGFVVARRMHDKGYDVTVILVDGKPVTKDAVINYELLKEKNITIADMAENNRALIELKKAPDIIVDAIYGTGFKGKLSSNGLKAAIYINRYSKHGNAEGISKPAMVAALDIPSGMSGDLVNKKELDGNAVKADFTITFHAKKPVHVQSFAEEYCGEIFVVDIGIDEERLWNVGI